MRTARLAGSVRMSRYPAGRENFPLAAVILASTDKWRRVVTAALRETPLSANLVDGYSARHLTVLEGLEAVRKRPGMYIGSTDGRGMLHCLWELIDNAVDEALNATCTRIEVILHADHSAEVRDNGRGIPVDIEPKTGLNGVELVMT